MCHPYASCIRISDSLIAGFRLADWKYLYSAPSDDTSDGTEFAVHQAVVKMNISGNFFDADDADSADL